MTNRNPILDLFLKAQGSAVIALNLVGQQRVPFLPPEQLHAMRDRRLRQIVRYAAGTVPYYRNFFRAGRLDPDEIGAAPDLAKLPLIDKDMLRRDPEQFVSSAIRGRPVLAMITSGSTGTPLQIFHDRDSVLANAAFSERELAVKKGMFIRGDWKREAAIVFPNNATQRVRSYVRANAFVLSRSPRAILSFVDPIEKVIADINQLRPDVISSYGSYLELLFRTIKIRRIEMHLPKVAAYYSDMLTEGGQRLIEEEFGIPVISQYAANEAFKIGFTCAERRGFHLHDDLVHVRIIDQQGRDAAGGEPGEVVISNLVNRGTVLLNYRLGDIASLSEERCPCGRTLPLLKNLEGRTEDILYLPDGRYLHPRMVWRALRDRTDILQYQLVQRAPGSFELKLAMADRAAFERSSGEIVARLQSVLGEATTVIPVYQDAVQPYGVQKFRSVISLVERDKLAEASLPQTGA